MSILPGRDKAQAGMAILLESQQRQSAVGWQREKFFVARWGLGQAGKQAGRQQRLRRQREERRVPPFPGVWLLTGKKRKRSPSQGNPVMQ